MSAMPLRLVCHCGTIRQAARALTALYDAKLAPHGIKITQFTVMMVVKSLGEPSTGELAQALVMDSTTLSRTLATLRRSGLIDMRRGRNDLRVRHWFLTMTGEARLQVCEKDWQEAQEEVTQLYGIKNLSELDSKMYALSKKISAASQEANS